MTNMTNYTTYTQEGAEILIATCLRLPIVRANYVTNFGSGESWDVTKLKAVKINKIKKELLQEYDDLWKELSNR